MKYTSSILFTFFINSLCFSVSLAATSVDQLNRQVMSDLRKSANVQTAINHLAVEQDVLDHESAQLLLTLANTRAYNQQLTKKIVKFEDDIDDLSAQIVSVARIDRDITPLMTQMMQSLQAFVAADIPFQLSDRLKQLQGLSAQLSNPDLSLSAKYQKLLQAFVEEAAYAEQMQSYQGHVIIQGNETQVIFLRLGRVAWYYQKLDGSAAAIWQQGSRRWIALDTDSNTELRKAIDMASNIGVPQLINFNFVGGAL